MTKEEFIEKVKDLPGVGPKTAEKLYDAGYTDVDALKQASVDDLVEKGIGKKTAEAILQGLEESEAPAGEQAVTVREEKAEAAEAPVEVVEELQLPKQKPELGDDVKAALEKRAVAYKQQPEFKRYFWWYKASLRRNPAWRAPKGTLNKQRRGFKYRSPRVKVGYGKPAASRGLHPSGFREVLVYNANDLEAIDPKTQAARIGGSVGGRKRQDIQARAKEMNIRVLNPRRGA